MKKILFILLFFNFNLHILATSCSIYFDAIKGRVYNKVTDNGDVARIYILENKSSYTGMVLDFHDMKPSWNSGESLKNQIYNTRTFTLENISTPNQVRYDECLFSDTENSDRLFTNDNHMDLDDSSITSFQLTQSNLRGKKEGSQKFSIINW